MTQPDSATRKRRADVLGKISLAFRPRGGYNARVIGWFRNRRKGYRCDGCGRWTRRREGRATVRRENRGSTYPQLYCPGCARGLEAELEQRG